MSNLSEDRGLKYDKGKPRTDLLLYGVPHALEEVSCILGFGAEKYAAHSWKTVPDAAERYLAALQRHILAHCKGEIVDPESGRSHLAHAACNALFILELQETASTPGKSGELLSERFEKYRESFRASRPRESASDDLF